MQHVALLHKTIAGAGFDQGDANTPPSMEVVWRNMSVTKYTPVTSDMWHKFLAADSKIDWLSVNTKGLDCTSRELID